MADQAFRIAAETNHLRPQWAGTPFQCPPNLMQITQRAVEIFMLSKQPDGEMGGIGWWQTANGYTAVALHDLWSGGRQNYDILSQAIRQCESRHPGLINEFNDDTLWWAMCCMDMYTIAGDPWFLEKAKGIWKHVRGNNSVCGRGQVTFQNQDMEGACFWTTRPDEGQINSISSGLYAELSARLAVVERNNPSSGGGEKKHHKLTSFLHRHDDDDSGSCDEYIEAARCSLAWILRCRYRPQDGIVLDGIRLKKGEAIDWAFTYLTGVAIGASATLYEATGQQEYLALAIHMAHKAMRNPSWVENDGVLTERGSYGKGNHDPAKNDDAVGFKSVLMRNLAKLYEVIGRTNPPGGKVREEAELIRDFVNITFRSLQERDTNGNGQYGPWWNGPFEMPTSHSQMAAMDVMAAVMLVNRA